MPVVIVTGYPESDLLAEAMKHGPLLLLPKPFTTVEVEKVVSLAIGSKRTYDSAGEVSVPVP